MDGKCKSELYPGPVVCVVAQDDLEKTEAIPVSFMTLKSKASK